MKKSLQQCFQITTVYQCDNLKATGLISSNFMESLG